MKKSLFIAILAVILSCNVFAQDTKRQFSINTNAWTTNYWNDIIYSTARGLVTHFAFKGNTHDSIIVESILPYCGTVFPIGMAKQGFHDPNDIYGPYHRAFSTPFKQLGDYGIGIDLAWTPSAIGLYLGGYFKSQEVCFMPNDLNMRANYFQPRAGLLIGKNTLGFEVGTFYDKVVGCSGSYRPTSKDMFLDGWGLDLALSFGSTRRSYSRTILRFSMPFHNFFNEAYADGSLNGMKRRVGYIMFSHRIFF